MHLPDWYTVEAVHAFLALAAPPLAICLVLGIAGAVLQTTTQIREAAIAFVPKAMSLLALIVFGGGLMISVARQYATHTFQEIPSVIHHVGRHE